MLRILIDGLVAETVVFSHSWSSKAIMLTFTVATNKTEDQIFSPVLVGWAIGPRDNNLSLQDFFKL